MIIKWGILGTGGIANKFAKDFEFVHHGKILAVASRSKENALTFSKDYGIEKAYDSYEKLAQDKDIDVIYITSPHNVHLENVILCLNNKKAVLCEKPMAVNAEQLTLMIESAKKNNVFLMEAMWTFFLPAIIKAKEWIQHGMIGDVEFITASFGYKANYSPLHRLFNPNLAGGALLDIGIYPIALSTLIMEQEPDRIISDSFIGPSGVDHTNAIILNYKNGKFAHLSSSLAVDLKNDAYIFGSKGYIHLPFFWMTKKAILYKKNEAPVEFEDKHPALGLNYETDEVNNLLIQQKKESQVMLLKTSLTLIKIMDEVRKQANFKYPFE